MGSSTPQAPPPPDPRVVGAAQTGSNISTGLANAVLGNANTVGPYGSTTYDQTGSQTIQGPNGESYQVPRYTSTTSLSPEQQGLYNQYTNLKSGVNQQASNALGTPFSLSGLPDVSNDYSADRSRVEQSLFDRLSPQLERDRSSLESQLVNQGFQRGTDAFNSAMDQYSRQVNDTRLAITGQGLQEQQGQFNMAQANRARALQELLTQRNQPISEVNAVAGLQPSTPNVPGYNAPQIGNTNIGDYIYNTSALQNKQYEQEMAQRNAAMGGMYGLGSAGLMAGGMMLGGPTTGTLGSKLMGSIFQSDRRLKTNIRDLGIRLMNGLKVYAYRYLWEARERVGVMADEVLRVRPQAVSVHGGFLAVDYGAL